MHLKSGHNSVFKEDGCQLTMCERERPKTQVGCSIRDGSKYEFNSFNELMDEDVCEGVIVACVEGGLSA